MIALNTLQTNANTIEKSIQKQHHEKCTNVQETEKYLQRSGISMKQLDRLSVIHVSGTKGKVSFTPILCVEQHIYNNCLQ